jgi:mono/diheme cytochrome c family protein
MKRWSIAVVVLVAMAAVVYAAAVIRRGFGAADQPSGLERVMARAVRNMGIPRRARNEQNPLTTDPEVLAEAKERFGERCANCHGSNGNGESNIGQNLYPKAPDLRMPPPRNI